MSSVQTLTEQQAKRSRRSHIDRGHSVSLIAFNTEVDRYEFDVIDSHGNYLCGTCNLNHFQR